MRVVHDRAKSGNVESGCLKQTLFMTGGGESDSIKARLGSLEGFHDMFKSLLF